MPTPIAPTIRVVFADDDKGLCRLAGILLSHEPDINLVATATTGMQAISATEEHAPDMLITDYRFPDMTGVQVCDSVSKINPRVRLVVVSGFDRDVVMGDTTVPLFVYVDKKTAFANLALLIRKFAI